MSVPLRSVHQPRRAARVDVGRGFESGHRGVALGSVGRGQHEQRYAVLLRGYGSRRLPAEAFLHLVSVVVAERRELTRPTRQ